MIAAVSLAAFLVTALLLAKREAEWRARVGQKEFSRALAQVRAEHWKQRYLEAEQALVQVHMSGTAGQQRPIHWTTMN